MSYALKGFAVVAALTGLDQAVKYAVETMLPFQQPVPVLPFLSWFRTWNEGIAFSLLSFLDDQLLSVLTVAISGFVLWLWLNAERERTLAHAGYALVLGGAIGNLIDRVWYGHVVDFVLLHAGNWSFAVFNLADSFITVGAILIVLDELLAWRRGNDNQDRQNHHPQG